MAEPATSLYELGFEAPEIKCDLFTRDLGPCDNPVTYFLNQHGCSDHFTCTEHYALAYDIPDHAFGVIKCVHCGRRGFESFEDLFPAVELI